MNSQSVQTLAPGQIVYISQGPNRGKKCEVVKTLGRSLILVRKIKEESYIETAVQPWLPNGTKKYNFAALSLTPILVKRHSPGFYDMIEEWPIHTEVLYLGCPWRVIGYSEDAITETNELYPLLVLEDGGVGGAYDGEGDLAMARPAEVERQG